MANTLKRKGNELKLDDPDIQNLPRALSSPGTTPCEAEERESFLQIFEEASRQAKGQLQSFKKSPLPLAPVNEPGLQGHPNHPHCSCQSCVWGMTGHLEHTVHSYHRASASFSKSSSAHCKF
ncbi:unnamed protein product [Gulo gulo]|uniref:Uncharacterized protein n=1 Tax=Gulo gulo TaxID=48420 RepID=A0A9X9Q138_GULGU|nr:unnamed protein product [Gulo gulo]